MQYRVTEILDGMLDKEFISYIENNSKAKRKAVRDEAFRVGTTVDELVQQDIKEGGYLAPEGDEAVCRCMEGWETFKKDYPTFVESVADLQTTLINGDVIGHLDFLVKEKLRWGVVDLKCATGIRPKYWTQTAQYSHMVLKHIEPFLLKVHEVDMPRFIGVLRLDKKTGLYEYKEITDETYIRYEIDVFSAYKMAFTHNEANREQIRLQLEEELLND